MQKVSQALKAPVRWIGQRDPRAKRHKSDRIDIHEWERYRPEIEYLYITQDKTQQEVDQDLSTRYGFNARSVDTSLV